MLAASTTTRGTAQQAQAGSSRASGTGNRTDIRMSLLNRLLSPFKEFGLLSGVLYILDQLCLRQRSRFRVFDYDLMVQPVADKPMAPANLTKSFEVRRIDQDDPLLHHFPPPPEIIADRYRQGSVCLGAFRKGEFVGYQWLQFGPYEEDEVRCTFVPGPANEVVFDYDFYLFPEHRLGLAFVALWDAANAFLRERDISYTASRVSRFNLVSRKSHQHFNWQKTARAVFFTGKRGQLMFCSRAPFVHLSFSTTNRPQLHIDAISGST